MKIEGYFGKIKNAKDTVDRLKGLGFKNAFVDNNSHYIEDTNMQARLPGTETAVSLSGMVLETATQKIERDKGPLQASSPMVSGYGDFEEVADVNCKVVVDVEGADINKVKKIIKDMGGELESPNFRKPRLENEEEVSMYNTFIETQDFLNGKS